MTDDGGRFYGMPEHWAHLHVEDTSPPPPVIPVVFVPGIMGSNLRVQREFVFDVRDRFIEEGRPRDFTDQAWRPPNVKYSTAKMLWEAAPELLCLNKLGIDSATVALAKKWDSYGPKLRQALLDPKTTEVDDHGFIPGSLAPLRSAPDREGPEEARRRGWGGLHWDSYGSILGWLENNLHFRACSNESATAAMAMAFENHRKAAEAVLLPPGMLPDAEEVQRAARYRFPVFAFGYNWTRSNLESARLLLEKVEEWIAEFQQAGRPCRQVILVTHSMGGLVARAAAKIDRKEKQRILGVIHGVMPAIGAPVLYRRMAAGTEPEYYRFLPETQGCLPLFAGRTAADTTAVTANSPGCLELLPSHLYPKGWLKVERDCGGGKANHLFALPSGDDPYGEIYREREAWWRLVDPQLLDPVRNYSRTTKESDPRRAWGAFLSRICDVKEFHRKYLDQNDYHDFQKDFHKTFVFYGQGNKSFGSVRWRLSPVSQALSTEEIRGAKGSGGDLLGMRRFVSIRCKERTGPEMPSPFLFPKDPSGPIRSYPAPGGFEGAMEGLGISAFIEGSARLQPQDGDGDGTVPVESGGAPGAQIENISRLHGFDHQKAFQVGLLPRLFTLMGICKLASKGSP